MDTMRTITHPDAKFSEEKIYHFKTTFSLKKPIGFSADVFADARYKLYLNGHLIAVGPCRGNKNELFFDSFSHSEYLKEGENTLEAVVLQLKNEFDGRTVYANIGTVVRTGNLRFALKGNITCEDGNLPLETDESWQTACYAGILFVGDENYIVGLNEVITPAYFSALDWKTAKKAELCTHYDADKEFLTQYGRYTVREAPIPPQRLDSVSLTFDENGICDAGIYTTAYVKYILSGKGKIRFTYAECKLSEENGKLVKGDRTDENGIITGYSDEVEIDGEQVVYEPYWFKSFRFIKADITGDVTIEKAEGFDTGYPLAVEGDFSCNSETDCKLWQVSLHTLKQCMKETYVDCPYYEQEQYLMDTRMQILYSYYVSHDDRLARRTLQDFVSAQFSDGMILARTPDILPQIIPGFSLYYIFILYDHYNHFGDIAVVKQYINVAGNLLRWFSNHLSEKGLVKRSGFWNFVDWASGWEAYQGTPLGEENEDMTIYTLMYAVALQRAAYLYQALGDEKNADLLRKDAAMRINDVKKHCFDESRMLFADGPSKKYFSAHAQLWAVLSDAVEGDLARTVMENSFTLQAQPRYGYIYDYFRALEKCGLYEKRDKMLSALRHLISLNCTTIPEEPENPRSECHGWGSAVLYEYGASDLGVRVNEPDNILYIKPYIKDFNEAKGTVTLNKGNAVVSWKKQNNSFRLSAQVPKGYLVKIIMPDGKTYEEKTESITMECAL